MQMCWQNWNSRNHENKYPTIYYQPAIGEEGYIVFLTFNLSAYSASLSKYFSKAKECPWYSKQASHGINCIQISATLFEKQC